MATYEGTVYTTLADFLTAVATINTTETAVHFLSGKENGRQVWVIIKPGA